MYDRDVATLTDEQVNLLMWMVESRADSFTFEMMYGDRQTIVAVGGSGGELELSPRDLNELVELRLVRRTTGHGYELTNDGLSAYRTLTTAPPPEQSPPGFHPPSPH